MIIRGRAHRISAGGRSEETTSSWGHIWLKIALPISRPVVLTGGIMLFMHQFEAFFRPLVAAPSPEHTLVQVASATSSRAG